MPAFIRKGSIKRQARLSVNARFRAGRLEHGPEEVFTLGVGDCTGGLTLLAPDAALRVDKYGSHQVTPLSEEIPDEGVDLLHLGFDNVIGNW